MTRMNGYHSDPPRARLIEGRARDQIIEEYIPKVRLIASLISSRIGGGVEFAELVNAGLVGLLDAIDKFDPSRNSRFTTYAEFRIRGAILDSLRSLDLLSRTAREKSNHLKKLVCRLQRQLGREPSSQEVAEAMGISLEAYYELLEEVKVVMVISIDASPDHNNEPGRSLAEALPDTSEGDPFSQVAERDFKHALKGSILGLPERLREIVMLYYYKELNFKEIGRVLELSESRVCQLHAEAMLRLRVRVDRLMGTALA